MRLLCDYLKEHIRSVCLYIGFIGIFAVVFYLSNVRLDAVLYAFFLSVIWLVLYGGIGFVRYADRHRKLLEAGKQIKTVWAELPEAFGLIEQDYQSMIKELFDSKVEMESEEEIARQEMIDYYSLWAHQIKTPIAAMRVLLQSWEEEQTPGDQTHLKELKLELFKIEQYVEMVLSYLRLGDMASDMVLQWYSLDDIVRQAVRKYSQMFILQKMKLDFTPSEDMVLTDEKWLVFVVEQLLSNALKYTRAGSISVYADKSRGAEVLVIEDTGIGIQEEDLPRVFEKGFTGYNGRKDKKSTGIGLYLCKTVMDRLGHGLWIESEVGAGTRVFLSLERDEIVPE
ncbi:sensor histidine kinase [[Clostridium] hylemonae]|uniref:sensor histidine kinase n=1 Tax=[Clostridium] hylemonae TaxID=89153 RepID=UPI001FCB559B|nr:sensor histidine kinase [[Clostridium] hylemonae]BDF04323.1 sensor histidine kinase [[Clostridium] hylemonae]